MYVCMSVVIFVRIQVKPDSYCFNFNHFIPCCTHASAKKYFNHQSVMFLSKLLTCKYVFTSAWVINKMLFSEMVIVYSTFCIAEVHYRSKSINILQDILEQFSSNIYGCVGDLQVISYYITAVLHQLVLMNRFIWLLILFTCS